MSLLRRKDSIASLPYDDDDIQAAGWSKLSDDREPNDNFPDDLDDDDLSFDGIYDDDPPVYRADPSTAAADVESLPDGLPRLLNALSMVDRVSNSSNRSPRQHYPGIDVCIVGSSLSVHSIY
jgi:hypothetical protein